MPMELKELQDTLTKARDGMKAEVEKICKETGDAATAASTAIKKEIDGINQTINSITEQMKVVSAQHVPGLDKKEAKKFDFGAFCGGLMREFHQHKSGGFEDPWKGAEQEKEMCKETMKLRAASAPGAYSGDGTAGGYLIPDEVSSEFVDAVMADTPIMGLGPTTIKGLIGDLPIPRKTTRSTAYMVGENTAPTESAAAFGQVWFRPKKAGAFSRQSNRLIYQTRGTSDTIIREDIQQALSLKIDNMLIQGSGSGYEPKGIINVASPTTTTVDLGSNGGRFRVDHASQMIKDIDVANEYKQGKNGSFGFLFRPEVKWGLKRERVTQWNGQTPQAGFPLMMNNLLMTDAILKDQLGHEFATTTLMKNDYTVGSSSTCSKVIFGNWKLFYVASWRDMIFKASDVASDGSGNSALLNDELFIVCFMEFDCQSMRDSAFTIASGAETTESSWSATM